MIAPLDFVWATLGVHSDQRAQRNPMRSNELDALAGLTVNGVEAWAGLRGKGPAAGRRRNAPPRVSRLGSPASPAPSRQLTSVVLMPGVQRAQVVDGGTQSATYSVTLPTMSNAPADE